METAGEGTTGKGEIPSALTILMGKDFGTLEAGYQEEVEIETEASSVHVGL